MYRETTAEITVTVEPEYLEDHSAPEDGRFVWAYHVCIENRGTRPVRLLTRHWRITDAVGKIEEVRGVGVVGEQPLIAPGETFEYTSGAPLATPTGFMVGSYGMEGMDGGRFEVKIPAFSLDSPYHRPSVQ